MVVFFGTYNILMYACFYLLPFAQKDVTVLGLKIYLTIATGLILGVYFIFIKIRGPRELTE